MKIYQGRRVLVTGHTGFKGSRLARWLRSLGAEVTGLALPAEHGCNAWDGLEYLQDITDQAAVVRIVQTVRPEVVFHLAAQALVRPSYDDPVGTWQTNLNGTLHILEACRQFKDIAAIVMVTTDKCYANDGRVTGYTEDDRLGGHDPYSASKAACELVSANYREAFGLPIATARAGNVIGGGDFALDRLIPDVYRACTAGQPLAVRRLQATRPWQHVLDCLYGYLLLGQALLEQQADAASAWNFGPQSTHTVQEVLQELALNGLAVGTSETAPDHRHEMPLLQLNSDKARCLLGWKPRYNFAQSIALAAAWYKAEAALRPAIEQQQMTDYAW